MAGEAIAASSTGGANDRITLSEGHPKQPAPCHRPPDGSEKRCCNVGNADVLCIWLTFGELEAFEERDMQREAAQTGKAWTSIGVAS